ncbi:MAG: hypothetical protein V1798_09075 [Pseudomonadota bacterium]
MTKRISTAAIILLLGVALVACGKTKPKDTVTPPPAPVVQPKPVVTSAKPVTLILVDVALSPATGIQVLSSQLLAYKTADKAPMDLKDVVDGDPAGAQVGLTIKDEKDAGTELSQILKQDKDNAGKPMQVFGPERDDKNVQKLAAAAKANVFHPFTIEMNYPETPQMKAEFKIPSDQLIALPQALFAVAGDVKGAEPEASDISGAAATINMKAKGLIGSAWQSPKSAGPKVISADGEQCYISIAAAAVLVSDKEPANIVVAFDPAKKTISVASDVPDAELAKLKAGATDKAVLLCFADIPATKITNKGGGVEIQATVQTPIAKLTVTAN